MKFSEKESFIKSFLLFFTVIMLFLIYLFYDNVRDETAYTRSNLLLEMKNYSLNFEDKRFSKKVSKKQKVQAFYALYEDEKYLYMLAPQTSTEKKEMTMVIMPSGVIMIPYKKDSTEAIKISYPKAAYKKQLSEVYNHFFWQFLMFALGGLLLSLLAAWYTLRPLRSSLSLLEDFIKDIIHDLNTPLSAIMLNLKMIESKDDEIESIRTATQTIEMLHHNLDSYLREETQKKEYFFIKDVVDQYVTFFAPLYDDLQWSIRIDKLECFTDKQAFSRIIYNLLSNACKYNISNGTIEIILVGTCLSIRNSSYGVKNPERVFERFYKESERGLGIGLHIVDKLCHALHIDKKFMLEGTDVTVELECKDIMVKSV